jgi:hypothetical protein
MWPCPAGVAPVRSWQTGLSESDHGTDCNGDRNIENQNSEDRREKNAQWEGPSNFSTQPIWRPLSAVFLSAHVTPSQTTNVVKTLP